MAEPQANPDVSCPFCGLGYAGRPDQCKRCGTLLNDDAEASRQPVKAARKAIAARKALADTFFLIGLLLGGPMMSIGDNLRVGLFIVLAGGLASLLRRYTDSSTAANLVLGTLGALIAATTLVDLASGSPVEADAAGTRRAAYAAALDAQDADVFVETRGLEHVAIWFTVPQGITGECGEYPSPDVRSHLEDLGFRRVVITIMTRSGGLCSFSP